MKLIVAVVQDYDVDRLLSDVTAAGLGATRIASTGGYLRSGNATVLLGVADGDMARALEHLTAACGARIDRPEAGLAPDLPELYASGVAGLRLGGGVIFVVPVRRFERVPW